MFVKGYRFLSFAKNMGKKIGIGIGKNTVFSYKNVSENLSVKYSQKNLDHAKQPATDALKTSSQTVIQKTTEATGNLIDNNIADAAAKPYGSRIVKVSKTYRYIPSEKIKRDY